jgi:hypothetical protein
MTMTKKKKALVRAYAEELVFAALVVTVLLVLDRQRILSRHTVTEFIVAVYRVVEKSIVGGILGFGVLAGAPFGLLAFAGDTARRQILEHKAFLPFVIAYGLTTLVVGSTYFTSPIVSTGSSSVAYATLAFLWTYSAITLLTALRTAVAFVQLVQNLHHLEKQLREGRVPSGTK